MTRGSPDLRRIITNRSSAMTAAFDRAPGVRRIMLSARLNSQFRVIPPTPPTPPRILRVADAHENVFAVRDSNNFLPLPCRTTNGSPDSPVRDFHVLPSQLRADAGAEGLGNRFLGGKPRRHKRRGMPGAPGNRRFRPATKSVPQTGAPNLSSDATMRATSMMSMPTPRIIY